MSCYKRPVLLLGLIITILSPNFLYAAYPGGRYSAASWLYDSKLWVFGGQGWDESSPLAGLLSDMWSYNPLTNLWNFEGGNKVKDLIGLGGDPGTFDPGFNPGGLANMCAWTDDTNKLWLFGGEQLSSVLSSAVWKYDPDISQWANMRSGALRGSYGPLYEIGARVTHKCVSFGATTYVNGGYGSDSSFTGYLNDLWYYDRSNNAWNFVSGEDTNNCAGTLSATDTPSTTEYPVCGSRIAGWIDSNNALYFAVGQSFQGTTNQVFKFEETVPSQWTKLSATGALTKRSASGSVSTVGKAWIFGGFSASGGFLADLLEWDGTTWILLKGPTITNEAGVYPDSPGTGDQSNYPGSRRYPAMWLDGDGILWLFGGDGFDTNGNVGLLNDLWKYSFSTTIWTWVGGSKFVDQNGNYTNDIIPPISTPIDQPVSIPVNSPEDSVPPVDGPATDAPTFVPGDEIFPAPSSALAQSAKIAIGVTVPGVVIGVGLLVLLLLLLKKKKKRKAKKKEAATTSAPLTPEINSLYNVMQPVSGANSNNNYSHIGHVGTEPSTTGTAPNDAAAMSVDNRLIPYASVTLDKEIGVGSFGRVYLGKLRTTKVAIKVANSTIPQEEFIREANFQAAIPPHPNIVQLLGVSIDGPLPLVVLEYCNEGSLDNVLFETDKLSTPAEQIALAEAIARGIDHLHQNNIVHRDLAVRNILLHHGEPKISDFGMSRKLKELSEVGKTATNIGPLRWMAPEALGKRLYSTKSDVWSFGMILYEIVARKEPHESDDVIDIAIKIRDEGYTPTIPESCPKVLREVMLMCWKMDPNERPEMGAICAMLEKNATV